MPAYKWTMIFTYFSGLNATNTVPVRLGGFTESYYSPAFDITTRDAFDALIVARLGICPLGMVVNKIRVQQVDPTRSAILYKRSFAAPGTWLSDVPQMALKVQFQPGIVAGAFLREFRGLPDVQVMSGEYSPTGPFTAAANAFLTQLATSVFTARRRDRSLTKYSILSIDATGNVVMTDPFAGIAVGQTVQVIRTVNPQTGRKFGFFAKVQAVTDPSHFQLVGPKVKASGFGQARLMGIVYGGFGSPQLDNAEAVVRKIGRPLKSYSGRASKRQ